MIIGDYLHIFESLGRLVKFLTLRGLFLHDKKFKGVLCNLTLNIYKTIYFTQKTTQLIRDKFQASSRRKLTFNIMASPFGTLSNISPPTCSIPLQNKKIYQQPT